MQILVVGGGGREHALVWSLQKSSKVEKIYCAPGNAGIANLAECVDISAEDIEALLKFALDKNIDLTVVGPEVPLNLGIVDKFRAAGLKIFGPTQKAAEIEGSKAFSKQLMEKYAIPTAAYEVCHDVDEAKAAVEDIGLPCVIKADGLAAGKGVIICYSEEEAQKAIYEMLLDEKFGTAGHKLVVEEFLEGEEVSILAFTDGKTVIPMVSAQDHKRIYDNDQGPNTGGMGAYSPAPIYTAEIHEWVVENILEKTVAAMAKEGREYQGVLYAGLMLTKNGPKVLEYNARFGDPETQAVLPRLETDLVDIIEGVIEKRLEEVNIHWSDKAAICVVLASQGYPEAYEKGKVIDGLDDVPDNIQVFHAGTASKNEQIITNGGRVLGVVALGDTIPKAIQRVYEGVDCIKFSGRQFRRDIGKKALKFN